MAYFEKTKIEYQGDGGSETVSTNAPLPTSDPGGATSLLFRILNMLMSPLGYDKSLGRQRVTAVVESGTVGTVTTVTTVTNFANIDGRPGGMFVNNNNLSAWYNCVRTRIT